MMPERTLFHALLTFIIPFIWIHLGKCSSGFFAEGSHKQTELNSQYDEFSHVTKDMDIIVPECELVYSDYLKSIENFTHCEIHHVRPFRLCLNCWEHYQAAKRLYTELNRNPRHEECKTKYMMSDVVQIIPTVQTNMDKMLSTSHCHRCYTKNDTMREKISVFLTLYSHFNVCINASAGDDSKSMLAKDEIVGNTSNPCIRCKSQYVALNAHFNALYSTDDGDVCMDIMDMMNLTRIMWSSKFNCTPGSYDSTPVIVISCIVACTPIVFYVYLRMTGKVRRAKLFKPKRLTANTETSGRTPSTSDSFHSSG